MVPKDRYTHGHDEAVLVSHRWRTKENSAAYLLPHLRPGQALLDIGCGPATLTADLAEVISPGRCVAVDREPMVLSEATATFAERGLSEVEVVAGDVYALDFAESSFDVVHAHQVLQHLSDPVSALKELKRVTRPGGVIACRDSDYSGMIWYPRSVAIERWRDIYIAVARANDAEPDAGRCFRAWTQRAGLDDVDLSASVWIFATGESCLWWSQLWARRLTDSTVGSQAQLLGIASSEELAAVADAYVEWSRHSEAWFLVPHGEFVARVHD